MYHNAIICKFNQKDLAHSKLTGTDYGKLSQAQQARATKLDNWIHRNTERKDARKNVVGIKEYTFVFPPPAFPPPPAKPMAGQFFD